MTSSSFRRPTEVRPWLARVGPALLLGALVVYLAFRSGGFYRDGTATAVLILAVALLLRIGLARDPFRGYGPRLAAAAIPLALVTGWTLASAVWSDSPGRAVDEFNRALLYLLALAFFGSFSWSSSRAKWLVRASAFAIAGVCIAAFVSRALPEVIEVPAGYLPARLSFPLTYWNTLALMAASAMVLSLSMVGNERESAVARVLAAAAMPVLAVTLLLTFSRGGIAVAVAGLLLYVGLAHTRGLLTGLVAVGPLTAVAVVRAYDADLLATADPTTPAAVAQGQGLAEVVLLCSLGAAVLRLVFLPVDARLGAIALSPARRRSLLAGGLGFFVVVGVIAAVAVDLPGRVDREYAEFTRGGATKSTDARTRERLASGSDNGRLDNWRVARESFRSASIKGQGAGTYETEWAERRPTSGHVVDAHSLYFETAAELGLVGTLLLLATLISITVGLAWAARGPSRAPWAAFLVCAVMWLVRAGVDWDWEMPAATVGFFAAGGLGLAARREGQPLHGPRPMARVLLCLGAVVLSLLPLGSWLSHRSLEQANRQFDQGRCPEAIASALDSTTFLNAYAEPYEILGYCDARLGEEDLSVRMMSVASRRDPDNWRYHYGLAIVGGVARLDPRPQAERARSLNPRSETAEALVRQLSSAEAPRDWEQIARKAPVPGR